MIDKETLHAVKKRLKADYLGDDGYIRISSKQLDTVYECPHCDDPDSHPIGGKYSCTCGNYW